MEAIENKSLQETLKRLEQELEEAKDDLEIAREEAEDAEENRRKEKEKLREAENQLATLEYELGKKDTQIHELHESYKATEEEVQRKRKALEFVNSVLMAKLEKVEDNDAKVDKIKQIINFVENDFCSSLVEFNEISKAEAQSYSDGINKWGILKQKDWLDNKKVISFVGEFSAGKTSIINSILGKLDLLPVNSKATTAIPTYLSYKMGEQTRFTDTLGNVKSIDIEKVNLIKKDFLSEIKISSLLQYLIIGYPNENLRDISVLDTPGFNSNDPSDEKRTAEIILEADILFWVFDVNAGEINQTSINIIRKHIKNIPLVIVINKVDTKAKAEVDSVEEKVKKTMKQNGILVQEYLRFSQDKKHEEGGASSVENLLNIIAKIEKSTDNEEIIHLIHKKLIDELQEAEAEYLDYRTESREREGNIKNIEEIFYNSFNELRWNMNAISVIPQENTKWFSENFYRLSKSDFDIFSTVVNSTKKSVDYLEQPINRYKNEVQNYIASKNKQDSERKQRDALQKLLNVFEEKIKSFDQKLMNDLILKKTKQ